MLRRERRRSRVLLTMAGVATAALALAGCTGNSSSAGSSGSKSITIGIEAGSPQGAYFQKLGPEFTKETGIKVKFLAIPHNNMYQKFLTDAVSGTGAYDVFTVDEGWMAEFAAKGYLSKLDDSLSTSDKSDFVPSALATGTYKGHIYSLPYLVHNLVLYYRTDLFQQAGIASPPTTWAEYEADAVKLTDPANHRYGTVVEGVQDAETYTHLMSMVQQSGGDIAKENGAPAFDNQSVKQSFEFMQKLEFQDKAAPAGLSDLTTEQGDFLDGNVAMIMMWPYLYSMAKDPAQSKVVGKFAVAMPPGNPDQVSTNFAWSFGVNASSKNQDAAKKFVLWATDTKQLQDLAREQNLPVPRQSAMKAITSDTSLTAEDRQALSVFSQSVSASKTIPITPAFEKYTTAMAVAVSAVMSQSSSIDDAVSTAQKAMQSAYSSSGK